MYNKQQLFQDIRKKLKSDNLRFSFLGKHVFSEFYEISGSNRKYIFKINLSDRDIEREFKTLKKLYSEDIKVIRPIIYSKKYSYLVTLKEEGLLSLDELIHKGITKEQLKQHLYTFGLELKKIHDLDKNLVSDFHFCNIMFRDKELFLLDFADAHQGDEYENISLIYLNCRYKSKYRTKELFSAFLKGYGLKNINRDKLNSYIIKHIREYIIHNRQKRKTASFIKKIIYTIDIIKYKRHLNSLLGNH
ncbi:hypothetical protein KY345_01065 [Candidatus Woesearchaeota archaeon]|nr:hypothetical protein [Candidatus Woesearchaeota archaeon]